MAIAISYNISWLTASPCLALAGYPGLSKEKNKLHIRTKFAPEQIKPVACKQKHRNQIRKTNLVRH